MQVQSKQVKGIQISRYEC